MKKRICLLALAAAVISSPARAAELFGGLVAHDINTPWTRTGPEDGVDLQFGWRGKRLGKTPLQPYVFLTINTSGDTHYGAIGVSAKFGDSIFVRPGLGIATHTGSVADRFDPTNNDIEFGSRILFEPEIGVGTKLTDRLTLEACWIHMSHAQMFSRQNSGIQNFGVRLSWKLP